MGEEKLEIGGSNTPPEDVGRIVMNHVWVSLMAGLVPAPVIDLIGITGIQLNMLRRISNVYGIPFHAHWGKNILGSLVGGSFAPSFTFSLIKCVPFLGLAGGILTMSITAAASTYAVGKVFIQHFASGGTFLSFDPEEVREYYQEMFKEGEQIATGLKRKQKEN